jgi:hypothetical protein
MKRRDFLKLSAAAAAAPLIWIPKRAGAATAARGKVKHLLVLNAKGGLRSHALFNAVGVKQHCPWGAQASASEWKLGAVCGSTDLETENVAVLASVDHDPNGSVDIDHRTAANRIATGSPEGTVGLLTLIGQRHPKYASGFSLSAVPPVEIGKSEFGLGAGDASRYRPISIDGVEEGFAADVMIAKGSGIAAREKLDARFIAAKASPYRSRIEGFLLAKKNALTFADLLRDPRLDLIGSPNATDSGVTNQELIDELGNAGEQAWGPRIALALRFFGFGSPACVVTNEIYDMHDDEQDGLPIASADLVRQLAGLDRLLHRIPHPEGGSYWEHTMVAVVSEFSRNNTLAGTGFNSGNGSDHVEEGGDPCRNQAIAIMGGPITAKGRLIGASDPATLRATGKVFTSRSLLSTFLDVLGIESTPYWSDAPIEELFA